MYCNTYTAIAFLYWQYGNITSKISWNSFVFKVQMNLYVSSKEYNRLKLIIILFAYIFLTAICIYLVSKLLLGVT